MHQLIHQSFNYTKTTYQQEPTARERKSTCPSRPEDHSPTHCFGTLLPPARCALKTRGIRCEGSRADNANVSFVDGEEPKAECSCYVDDDASSTL
jgi:hypothetical protein